ncbi:hypothetical protein M4D79_13700 [Mycolicibacterium novocastrense]|nr:hypothetical protein M4D79_13700 [Mycolicibacterium novocastrense]
MYDMTSRSAVAGLCWPGAVRPDVPAADARRRPDRSLQARERILALSWALEAQSRAAALLWLSPMRRGGAQLLHRAGVLRLRPWLTGPALSSLLPQIVPRERLAAAIAANSMIVRGSTIAGPVFGGGLYAMGGGGPTGAACLLFFLAAIVLLQRVPVRYGERHTGAGGYRMAALHRRHPLHSLAADHPGTISLDLFAVPLGGVVALLPIYAQEVLEVGPTGLGCTAQRQ